MLEFFLANRGIMLIPVDFLFAIGFFDNEFILGGTTGIFTRFHHKAPLSAKTPS